MTIDAAVRTGPRLLYIDDDPGLCRLIKRSLERRGFGVETACSGADGVAACAAGKFDVVAVDHYMPGQDGLETLERLKALPRLPPVVYVTGSDESRIAVAALKAGAADYVVKTGSEDFMDLLASALEQAVERQRLRCAAELAEAALLESNARLEALVARQDVLMREVNHRVANSLQLVSALVHMQATTVKEPDAKAALRDTQSRIAAIMQVHRRLYTSDDVEQVEMAEYLEGLVAELRHSLPEVGAARPILLQADPVKLGTDKAVSLGVIVTELVTNAIKYAYAREQSGEVRITLAAHPGDLLRLRVEDDGAGMPQGDQPSRGTGLGRRVIEAMAKSLNSELQIDPAHRGVRAELTFAA